VIAVDDGDAERLARVVAVDDVRECNACVWLGAVDDCVWLGDIGPLCPECHETTGCVDGEAG
jgi:hypothetical protein